jgi:hypothetical protein
MAGDKLQLISNALIDVFGVLGIPTATAQGLIHRYIKNRANDALRILLEELRRGNIDVSKVADQNEVVDVIYQYGIAVRDNVALRNLRLLSQVFRGLICQGSLYADDFSKYASCLSTLNRDEIVVLGNLHACRLSATE